MTKCSTRPRGMSSGSDDVPWRSRPRPRRSRPHGVADQRRGHRVDGRPSAMVLLMAPASRCSTAASSARRRAEHDDDDLRRARRDPGAVGARRLLDGVRRRRRPPVSSVTRPSTSGWPRCCHRAARRIAERAHHPLRRLPGALLRRHRRRWSPARSRTGRGSAPGSSSLSCWTLSRLRTRRALGLRRQPSRATPAAGWSTRVGTVNFAGGMPVEITSGASALALAMVVGTRVGFGQEAMRPHNLTLVMLGAGPAVVRVVRLQRRLGPRGQPHRRGRLRRHDLRRRDRGGRLAGARALPRRACHHPRARRRAWSPAWSRSPRAAARSPRWAPW